MSFLYLDSDYYYPQESPLALNEMEDSDYSLSPIGFNILLAFLVAMIIIPVTCCFLTF